jgi:methyltransferase (TIGR00027 family)
MTDTAPTHVEITADGLIELRARSPLAHKLGIAGPRDRLFATKAGQNLARMAMALDPVYEQYNLVRYKWFGERLSQSGSFRQLLLLGAGYDTRTLTLSRTPGGRIFEVDLPQVLASKRAVLAANGVTIPDELIFVPADLASPAMPEILGAAGFASNSPTAVFAEGVMFFLPASAVARLTDPAQLGLAAGSRVAFDVWTADRIRSLNAKVREKTGRALFGDTPFGNSADEIAASLRRKGYTEVNVRSLGALSRDYGVDEVSDPLGDTWFAVTARVG